MGREEIGNIIRVAPIDTLRDEQRRAAEAYKNRQATEPLKVRLIPVNYAKASEMVDKIKDGLTERGAVSIDIRTNTLSHQAAAAGSTTSASSPVFVRNMS